MGLRLRKPNEDDRQKVKVLDLQYNSGKDTMTVQYLT